MKLTINTYRWTRKIFRTGYYKKDLEETDLYATLTQDRTSHLGEIIGKAWEKEVESCAKKKNGGKPQLLRVLLRCFGKPFLLIGVAFAVMELFSRYKQMRMNELHVNTKSSIGFIHCHFEIKDTKSRLNKMNIIIIIIQKK